MKRVLVIILVFVLGLAAGFWLSRLVTQPCINVLLAHQDLSA